MTSTEPVATAESVAKTEEENADFVDPWNVASASDTGVNYDKLIGMLENKLCYICVYVIHMFIRILSALRLIKNQ